MDSKNVVLWVAGFAGVLLIYSAYKGTHPLAVIQQSTGVPTPAPAPASKPTAPKSGPPAYDKHGNRTAN